ncbi:MULTISPECIES: XRE family transcriptional regulator [unclassified Meiothermus]|uniref:XRE family transcriptional regulator n=1 Tax=unclassified Meiothermus TaxID=370471 RepID=UPI001314B758|nr:MULTISPECIES: XRE family transcriptional regulator [unclassified Meiothermus]
MSKATHEPNPVSLELARALKEAGLSQAELARRLGVKQPSIARLFSPNYDGHSVRSLRGIANALGCRLEIRLIKPEEG